MEFWRYFWFYIRLSHGRMILVLFYSLLAMILQTLGLAMIALAMEHKLDTHEFGNPIIEQVYHWIQPLNILNISNQYIFIVSLTALVFATVSWILFMIELYVNRISIRIGSEQQLGASKLMLKSHSIFFERESIGNLNNVMTTQTLTVSEGFRKYIQLIIAFLAIIPFLVAAVIVNPFWVVVLIAVVAVPVIILMRGVAWNTLIYSKKQVQSLSKKNSFLLQMINAHQYIKSVGAEKSILAKYSEYINDFFSSLQKLNFWLAVGNHLLMGVLVIILCGVIFIETEYQKKSIIVGGVTMAFLYATTLKSVAFFNAYQKFLSILGGIQQYETFVHRMKRNIEKSDSHAPIIDFSTAQEIVFDDISAKFNYRKGSLFDGIKFSIPLGKITLISGESDALKSTLLHMISGMVPPLSGKIYLDESLPFSKSNINALRRKIGYLPETPRFFSGTVYENLTLFSAVPHEDMLPILESMHLLPVINALPEGLGTKMLDHDALFTAGEVRTLAIVRELIMTNEIYLIDHPSSHWNQTQIEAFFNTLHQFASNKTVIIISDDLRLNKYVDYQQLV